MRLLLPVLLLLVVSPSADAFQVTSGPWTSVTFETVLPVPFERAVVTAMSSDQRGSTELKSIVVVLGTHRIEIPQRWFADLAHPELRSLDLLYDPGDATRDGWSAYVLFEYGDPPSSRSVRISVGPGGVDGRMLYGGGTILLEEYVRSG